MHLRICVPKNDRFSLNIENRADMVIKNIGTSLSHILSKAVGQKINDVFNLSRPLIEFKFYTVRQFSSFAAVARLN